MSLDNDDNEIKFSDDRPMFQTLVNKVLNEQQEKNRKAGLKKTKVFVSPGPILKIFGGLVFLVLIYKVSVDQDQLKKSHELLNSSEGQRSQLRQNTILRNTRSDLNNKPVMALSAKQLYHKTNSSEGWKSLLVCSANSPWSGYGTGKFVKMADDFIISAKDRSILVMTPYYAGIEPVFNKSIWRSSLYKFGGLVGKDLSKYGQSVDLELPYRSRKKGSLNGSFFIRYGQYRGLSTPLYQYSIGGSGYLKNEIKQFRNSAKFWPDDNSTIIDPTVEGFLWKELEYQISNFLKNPRRDLRMSRLDSGGFATVFQQEEILHQCLNAANAYQKKYLFEVFQQEQDRLSDVVLSSPYLGLNDTDDDSSIDTNLIHRILGYNMPRLRKCFPLAGAKKFKDIRIAVEVARSGKVKKVRHEAPKSIQRSSLDCLAREIARIRLYVAQKQTIRTDLFFSFR